jgi:small subunit ribosomal protein S4
LFKKSISYKGVTGEVLLQLCEARLDNVVFRMGIAPSRGADIRFSQTSQLTVSCNISSTLNGDKVAVREKSKSLEAIERSLSNSSHVYEWITE